MATQHFFASRLLPQGQGSLRGSFKSPAPLLISVASALPIAVAGIVLPLAGMVLYRTLVAPNTDPVIWDDELLGEVKVPLGRRSVWQTLSCFGGLLAVTSLVGFFTANTVFFMIFLRYVVVELAQDDRIHLGRGCGLALFRLATQP